MQELVGEDAGAEVVAVIFVVEGGALGVGRGAVGVCVAGEEGGEGDSWRIVGAEGVLGDAGCAFAFAFVEVGEEGVAVVGGFEGEGDEGGGEEEEDAEADCFGIGGHGGRVDMVGDER